MQPFYGAVPWRRVLGLMTLAISRIYTRRSVDPIEANALFGGRMVADRQLDLVVVLQTIISNGVGASIGLEAAYTQIGSAIASKVRARVSGQAQRPAAAGWLWCGGWQSPVRSMHH